VNRVSRVRVRVRVSVKIRVRLIGLVIELDRTSRRGVSGIICRVPDV